MPVREYIDWNTIPEESFRLYENVRQSGVTNMLDVSFVEQLTGLDRDVILTIMEHYGKFDSKYPNVKSKNPTKPKLTPCEGATIIYKLPKFRWEQVNSAYIGTPHRCMCGCSGDYAYTKSGQVKAGQERGYQVKENEVSDRKVRTRINKMRLHETEGIENIEDYIFTEIIGNRQYTLYLFK